MSNRKAARVDLVVAKDASFDRELAGARRKLRGFARDGRKELGAIGDYGRRPSLAAGLGAAGKRAGGFAAKGAGMAAAGAAGVAAAGIVGVASMVDDAVSLERGLTRYQIATDASAESMGEFRDALKRTSAEAGINRQELLNGVSAYVALTGDAAGAASSMKMFGKVANATSSSMDDIAAVAASMKNNLGIDPKDFEAGFSALSVQGKAGAVELRELAAQLAGIAPSFSKFDGGMGTKGLIQMGAALQVVRQGFGSSAEAATGMRALMTSLQRNATKFGKKKIFYTDENGKKQLRDIRDIVDAIGNSKLARDPTKLTQAFGSDEAKRAYDQLIANRKLLDDLIVKGGDKNAIDRDAATFMASPAGKMQKAIEALKAAMLDAFTPDRIEEMAAAMEKLAGVTSTVVDFMDRLLTGGPKQGMLLGNKEMIKWDAAKPNGPGYDFSNHKRFRTEGQKLGYDNGLDGNYSIGALFDYGGQVRRQLEAQSYGPTARAGDMAASLPGGGVVRQVTDAMVAAAARMDLKVIIGGEVLGRAVANDQAHRTRPGGRR